jgi:putative hydrolase of the HAD superfamily
MAGELITRNLIIDLGGVVVDLDVNLTLQAMQKLAGSHELPSGMAIESPLFHQFERGEVGARAFRDKLREMLGSGAGDGELDDAWNAMILGVPRERLDWLERLRSRGYRMFLLSNTNEIHLPFVEDLLRKVSGARSFDPWFNQCYYSHRLGLRKPDPSIYEWVLSENDLSPTETMMIDDNPRNLEGAALAGLQTYHAESREHVLQFQ